MSAPLTERYNNPGAVEFHPWMEKYGASVGPNGRYAQFGSPDQGYQVMGRILDTYQSKHGLNTVSGIVNRWAPPNVDNNSTGSYATSVAKAVGVDPNAPLTPEHRQSLMQAMASYEAGRRAPAPPQKGNGMYTFDPSSPMADVYGRFGKRGGILPQEDEPSPVPARTPYAPPQTPPAERGFMDNLKGFAEGMFTSPLAQAGAAMIHAGSQGQGLGTGILSGSQAYSAASKAQAEERRQLREQAAQATKDKFWNELTGQQSPAWAQGLPTGSMEFIRALGPVEGAKAAMDIFKTQNTAKSQVVSTRNGSVLLVNPNEKSAKLLYEPTSGDGGKPGREGTWILDQGRGIKVNNVTGEVARYAPGGSEQDGAPGFSEWGLNEAGEPVPPQRKPQLLNAAYPSDIGRGVWSTTSPSAAVPAARELVESQRFAQVGGGDPRYAIGAGAGSPSLMDQAKSRRFGPTGVTPEQVPGQVVDQKGNRVDVAATRAAEGQSAVNAASPEMQERALKYRQQQAYWTWANGGKPAPAHKYYKPNGTLGDLADRPLKKPDEAQIAIARNNLANIDVAEKLLLGHSWTRRAMSGEPTKEGWPGFFQNMTRSEAGADIAQAFSDYKQGAMQPAYLLSGKTVAVAEMKNFIDAYAPIANDTDRQIQNKTARIKAFYDALLKVYEKKGEELDVDEVRAAASSARVMKFDTRSNSQPAQPRSRLHNKYGLE